ncbi:hypothetical protein E2C01_020169 [Portunus trituberculatus]|uniref:Uncharacterized protein n=1 Tax=Portunus trituberculatus TaxID=210409 RepID=A0A5B7E0K8_PORTR|nr:hypothetical protein [Portunus trituberculatus]
MNVSPARAATSHQEGWEKHGRRGGGRRCSVDVTLRYTCTGASEQVLTGAFSQSPGTGRLRPASHRNISHRPPPRTVSTSNPDTQPASHGHTPSYPTHLSCRGRGRLKVKAARSAAPRSPEDPRHITRT